MSQKTVAFRRKIGQLRRVSADRPITDILPTADVKSPGRKNAFASEDTIDDEGRKVRAGRFGRPKPTSAICTRRMSEAKQQRLARLVK